MISRVVAVLIVVLGFSISARAGDGPLLVELFTAQGCPSCPLAEGVLAQLAKRNDLVPLAFHVDYWDSTGWRDKFALPVSKTRQQGYKRVFRRDQVFTPQMVMNGTVDMPGQELEGVDKVLALLRARSPQGPAIALSRQDATLHVTVGASPAWNDAVVWMAVFDPEHPVDITRGKNRGRSVINVNVVRELRNMGVYSGEAWTMDADLAAVSAQQGIAVWLQPKNQGPVVATAVLPPG